MSNSVPQIVVKRQSIMRRDAEFLPAALEILETPASPNKIAFLLTICAFVVVALVWSYVGRLDIIATAKGKIQPSGRVRIIQPAETGKIAAIHVRNGQSVQRGDVLAELDAQDARADEASAASFYDSYRAERLRRLAVLAAARMPAFDVAPINWPDSVSAAKQEREDRVLAGDIGQLKATVAGVDAQLRQKSAEQKRLADSVEAQKALIDVLQQRVDMRAALAKVGAGPLTTLFDAQESLTYHSINMATLRGQLAENSAAADVLMHDRSRAIQNFTAENQQKLAEAERLIDDYEQRLAKARAHLSHLTLHSPIAGTVTASTIAAPGQVVTLGEEVMRIVPSDATMEIEGYLENKDVGFVKLGQHAEVKIESLPFTRFGTVSATVLRVGLDAIPEQDARQIEGDPVKASKSSGFAGAERLQNLVFPVTLSPDVSSVDADGTRVPLSPGMSVSVEIRTGSRRILEYVFSPLVETASTALRER